MPAILFVLTRPNRGGLSSLRSLTAACMLLQCGCGCIYGTLDPPTVSPAMDCLELSTEEAGCSDLGVTMTNHCAEPVVLSEGVTARTIDPESSLTVDPFAYGEVREDDDTCRGHVSIPAQIGATTLQIELTFEMVNRGALGC